MKKIIVISFTLLSFQIFGQDNAARIVEELVGNQDEDLDYETIYEHILQTLSNPINLNTVTRDELGQLQILTENQISEIIEHRRTSGLLVSIYELQSLKSFSQTNLDQFRYLFFVGDPSQDLNKKFLNRIRKQGNHYFITRAEQTLENKAGFTTSVDSARRFSGSPLKVYSRFRSNRTKDYSIGFTLEKDAGEKLSWQPSKSQYGFDFLSYHLQVQNKGRIKNLVLGDYQLQVGQGLIFAGGFGLGKGGETVTTTRRSNIGIMPYTSVNENGFFRGGAFKLQLSRHLAATMLYSNIKRDAAENQEESTVSSFQLSGFHRNSAELATRKVLYEYNNGLVLQYSANNLEAGVVAHRISFSQPIVRKPNAFNQFAFAGRELITSGVFLNYQFQNFNFFGEVARNQSGGTGLVAGVLTSLHRQLDASILLRRYGKNYYSFYSNAFSENTQPQNETGFYWGLKYQLNRQYTFSTYCDLFQFPWLGFRRYSPTTGHEYLLKVNYQPNRKTVISIQFRQENKDRNLARENMIYSVSPGKRNNIWVKMNYAISSSLSMKSQLQWNSYSIGGETSEGFVLIQDASYTIGKFQITGRHGIFDASNFDNRTYAYENDAFMSFSIPAYFGIGIRNYIMLEYKINRELSIWLRYARTQYSNKTEISSDVEKINGNIKKDVKFQALIRF